ncbi:hypothetical protein OE88DRAFT_1265896 [Heliocybe sulcata]|uniref:Uncharacterized protein n=1 Tax=Heliocybe sulcata TaxID=5364 RepID=A0A5C3N9V3_9AGAM|nr:hypothetical protein OE88DRAFT_1265896 [Heliocybe sulcata]
MATAIPPSPADGMGLLASNVHSHISGYPRNLGISELDLKDQRYPTVTPSSRGSDRRSSVMMSNGGAGPSRDDDGRGVNGLSDSQMRPRSAVDSFAQDQQRRVAESPRPYDAWADVQQHQSQLKESYSSSNGGSRRVVDRYTNSLDDHSPQPGGSGEVRQNGADNTREPSTTPQGPSGRPRSSSQNPTWADTPAALLPSSPRHPSLPAAGVSAGPNNNPGSSSMLQASGSATYNASSSVPIPVSPKPRAYAQHPTYVTPASAPNGVNPILSQNPPVPQEEVCIECAMRDQDMADVDVTSPGVWERESDIFYLELCEKEEQEEAAGVVNPDPTRPNSKGDFLTEHHLKIWISMNPKEPSARQQTVASYVKNQRMLLEAETLARAQALQESRLLENKARDTYSQLRRSAYELGSSAVPDDDTGGIRIKTPRSASLPSAGILNSHSREVTLLENGMIVEHVDVRKEEKERKKEEKRERSRARKSSRGSVIDVNSIYSVQSPLPHTDGGFHSGPRPGPRNTQTAPGRPMSVLTTDRPAIPRAYSQASFSDVQSIGSASPNRRSRFFGLGNLSPGWRSQNSLAASGMSGSMVDMHVALQREQARPGHGAHPSVDISSNAPSLRLSQMWAADAQMDPAEFQGPKGDTIKSKKKKKGLAKIWRIVTGASSKSEAHIGSNGHAHPEDDLPLAPPPPLSYLVDRGGGGMSGGDQGMSSPRQSMPSLPSSLQSYPASPAGMSPPTAPSSLLPSPSSSRKSVPDRDGYDNQKNGGNDEPEMRQIYPASADEPRSPSMRNMQAILSEPEARGRSFQGSMNSSYGTTLSPSTTRPASLMQREKSLPPLPDEAEVRFPTDTRPQTVFTYEPPILSNGLVAPQAPFRTSEVRRQSFGGISSRPQLNVNGPPKGVMMTGPGAIVGAPFASKYNEFGSSRRSLGRLDDVRYESQLRPTMQAQAPSKRKSRFGLSSLFGKKSPPPDARDVHVISPSPDYSGWRTSDSGEGQQGSGHSTLPRMSVMSRRNLEDLVQQDAEFVAYRYPSNDQRIDLLR